MSHEVAGARRIVRDIAHARAGDKGNISNVSVWAFDPADYPLLKAALTPERIKAAYPDLLRGSVKRYEVDHLHGLNFVMEEALEGGVNASLNLDSHGKSWSYLILSLPLGQEAKSSSSGDLPAAQERFVPGSDRLLEHASPSDSSGSRARLPV